MVRFLLILRTVGRHMHKERPMHKDRPMHKELSGVAGQWLLGKHSHA